MSLPRSDIEIEERASSAQDILENKVFKDAMGGLRERYTAQLVSSEVGSGAAHSAHAALKVLSDVEGALQSEITDRTMRRHQKRSNDDGRN